MKKLNDLGLSPEEEREIILEIIEKHEPGEPDQEKIIQEYLTDKFPKP